MSDTAGKILIVVIGMAVLIHGIYGVLNKKKKNNNEYQKISKSEIGWGIFTLIGMLILLLMGKL